jgi:hypothetical protein
MSSPKHLMIINFPKMHAWKYFGNKEEGCQMGKESKLGTNEEV